MGSMDTEGNKAALKNANNSFKTYNQDYNDYKNQYDYYRNQADQAWARDTGGTAQSYMQNAAKSGAQQANQLLDQAARGATNQAQLASRQAGLSKGQAAMNAAGAANQMYQNNYMGAAQQGQQNFMNAAQQNQQQKTGQQQMAASQQQNAAGNIQGAMGIQQGVGGQQTSGFDRTMGVVSGIGQAASGLAMFSDDRTKDIDWESIDSRLAKLMGSDERLKEPLPESDMIAEVAEEINNYKYHYKPGVGEDPSIEHSGIMAQELLQVDGYRACVFEDENGLLKVDTGRLALVNAGMIADLSKRVVMIEELLQGIMQGVQALMEPQEPVEQIPDVE